MGQKKGNECPFLVHYIRSCAKITTSRHSEGWAQKGLPTAAAAISAPGAGTGRNRAKLKSVRKPTVVN